MKKFMMFLICACCMLYSCQKEEVVETNEFEELLLDKYLETKVRGSGWGGPRTVFSRGGQAWQTFDLECVNTSTSDNPELMVSEVDYGTGCEDVDGRFFSGKLQMRTNRLNHEFQIAYMDFAGENWILNGVEFFSNIEQIQMTNDSSEWVMSYDFHGQIVEELNIEDGSKIIIRYEYRGSESATNTELIVENFEANVELDNRASLSLNSSTPQIYSFSCDKQDGLPQAGFESGIYRENGIDKILSIHYGNGKCDDLITIEVE